MANKEHLEILNKGVDDWNQWRALNTPIRPDLHEAHLSEADLRGVDLSNADLSMANLSEANLSMANLSEANLSGAGLRVADLRMANLRVADLRVVNLSRADLSRADLSGANLSRARLSKANLNRADLCGANLSRARLSEADLSEANLSNADLSNADLTMANLSMANLSKTDFRSSGTVWTIFANVDLSLAKGLETVNHLGPSSIGIDTINHSRGKIPEAFLRGCGLSDWEIEASKLYHSGLSKDEFNSILYNIYDLRAGRPIQINPLFISYSHSDSAFVSSVEELLNERGIRFWIDIHDATAGRLEKVVNRAIRMNPTVLLILSKNSVESDWVQHEARLARKLEIETNMDVLCPVALDESWKSCHWPKRLMEQIKEFYVLDFSNWRDSTALKEKFDKLIEGLDLFYQ
jgi:hypothetical protein